MSLPLSARGGWTKTTGATSQPTVITAAATSASQTVMSNRTAGRPPRKNVPETHILSNLGATAMITIGCSMAVRAGSEKTASKQPVPNRAHLDCG